MTADLDKYKVWEQLLSASTEYSSLVDHRGVAARTPKPAAPKCRSAKLPQVRFAALGGLVEQMCGGGVLFLRAWCSPPLHCTLWRPVTLTLSARRMFSAGCVGCAGEDVWRSRAPQAPGSVGICQVLQPEPWGDVHHAGEFCDMASGSQGAAI